VSIWFHGTNEKGLRAIKRSGFFKVGTYFAHHMEDAVVFGGPVVCFVEVSFKSRQWQVCSANRIPWSATKGVRRIL
jgi:hypothetical protein